MTDSKSQLVSARDGITIDDIAKRAHVSKSTVSRVLNSSAVVHDHKRAAVEKAIRELGFKPNIFAQGLASGRSMTLGILTQNMGGHFYDSIAQGAIEGLADSGYTPLFVDGGWEHTREVASIEALLSRKVDGLLVVGGRIDAITLVKYSNQVPLIVVERDIHGLERQCISVDNKQIGYLSTKYLLEERHSRIVFIHGKQNHPDARDRFTGYLQALREAGVSQAEELVYHGDFSGNAGLKAVNHLLDQGICFSAIVAENDMVAFGARLALYRHGIRVPEDISIIGCDDQEEAALMTPPLTTVRQPSHEMGVAAAKALLSLIIKKECELPALEPTLQIRESVNRFTAS